MTSAEARKLAEIIIKIRLRKASDEERTFLNNWLDECEENRQTYKRIVRGEVLAHRLKTEDEINKTTDFRRISRELRKYIVRRHRLLLWRRGGWSVAAAVVVGIFAYFLMTSSPVEKEVNTSFQTISIAAVPKADLKTVLVTADGNHVDLGKQFPDSLIAGRDLFMDEQKHLVGETKDLLEGREVKEEWNKVITSIGGEYFIVLDDGTRVWMNANTMLEFPVRFVEDERVVKLQGEAYFEVAHDAQKPFIVETAGTRTRVLGTIFNIKAYDDEVKEQTTLLEGKVEVLLGNGAIHGEMPVAATLRPGMQAQWQKGSEALTVQQVDTEEVVAWRRGMFIFNDESISAVFRTLSRWYGVEFVTDIMDKETYTFNGSISKDDKLEATLEVLALAGGLKFKIEGNKIYIRKK